MYYIKTKTKQKVQFSEILTRALRALPPRANSDYIGVRPSDFSREKSNFSRNKISNYKPLFFHYLEEMKKRKQSGDIPNLEVQFIRFHLR